MHQPPGHARLPLAGIRLLSHLDLLVYRLMAAAASVLYRPFALAEVPELLVAVAVWLCDADVLVEVIIVPATGRRNASGGRPRRRGHHRRGSARSGSVVTLLMTVIVIALLAGRDAVKGVQ